jgi:signal transduction histidine kinase
MRRQLAFAAAAISSMIVLALIVPLLFLVRTLAEDRAVANAERRAQVVVPVVATFATTEELSQFVAQLPNPDGTALTIFLSDGTVLGAPASPSAEVALARTNRAFNSETAGGIEVLQPVDNGRGTQVVRVFVPEAELRLGVYPAWALLVGLGVILVLVATLVADRLAKRIVKPVDALADTAERLSAGELDARAEIGGPPEIVEVGRTLNRLATRIGELLEAEREASADLSHRLRTPITALQLDVDALPDGDPKRRLVGDVDQLTRSVDRLIRDSRRPQRAAMKVQTDLAAIVRERVAFWSALADEQGRAFALEVPAHRVLVPVPEDELDAALDALLGNVFAHTAEGVGFRVRLEATNETSRLTVVDDGAGWPDQDVVERGTSGGGSTGLGLDIVRRTAEAAGGSLSLDAPPGGGAGLTVTLPLVPVG